MRVAQLASAPVRTDATTRGAGTRAAILKAAEKLFLESGVAGTSLDEVIAAAGTSKGAFFHHFRGKDDLARAVAERWASAEMAALEALWAEAGRGEEPLACAIALLRRLEEQAAGRPRGSLLASYTYETGKLGEDLHALLRRRYRGLLGFFEAKFETVIRLRKPRIPARARDLAEALASLIEGGLVLGRALGDPRYAQRQIAGFRRYVELLFAVDGAV